MGNNESQCGQRTFHGTAIGSICQVYIGVRKGETIDYVGDLLFSSDADEYDTEKILGKNVTSRTFSFYYPSIRPGTNRYSIVASTNARYEDWANLSDEEARKLAMMNQVVFELERHTIISGNIYTTIPREIEERDRLLIEESEESIVRPEEVLIFFENKRDGNNTRTIVPFSPAQPSQNPPAKSGASYNRN